MVPNKASRYLKGNLLTFVYVITAGSIYDRIADIKIQCKLSSINQLL